MIRTVALFFRKGESANWLSTPGYSRFMCFYTFNSEISLDKTENETPL